MCLTCVYENKDVVLHRISQVYWLWGRLEKEGVPEAKAIRRVISATKKAVKALVIYPDEEGMSDEEMTSVLNFASQVGAGHYAMRTIMAYTAPQESKYASTTVETRYLYDVLFECLKIDGASTMKLEGVMHQALEGLKTHLEQHQEKEPDKHTLN